MTTRATIDTMEAIKRETYPDSGSHILQLTSAPSIHSNIYCEVPYMDVGSRYIMFEKNQNSYGGWEVWRADLQTNTLTLVCRDVLLTLGIAVSFDQNHFFCIRSLSADSCEIIRTDIATLEQHTTLCKSLPGLFASPGAVSPDKLSYYISARIGDPQRHRFGILRIDLRDGRHTVIHAGGDDLCNAHTQIEPGRGQDLLIQHNRGAKFDDSGNRIHLVGPEGATLYLIDVNGANVRRLPVGKPYTQACQGHQSWIGGTGEIILTTTRNGAEASGDDCCLWRLRPGDERANAISRGLAFCHPNASKDGRFFVSDTFPEALIVVGSIKTGRSRILCSSGSSLGGPQYTHPHPYLSPDLRWVVFNSDRTGVPHVFAASVPDGLLEELE